MSALPIVPQIIICEQWLDKLLSKTSQQTLGNSGKTNSSQQRYEKLLATMAQQTLGNNGPTNSWQQCATNSWQQWPDELLATMVRLTLGNNGPTNYDRKRSHELLATKAQQTTDINGLRD